MGSDLGHDNSLGIPLMSVTVVAFGILLQILNMFEDIRDGFGSRNVE